MYLTKNNRSPYYQIVYEVEGKLTTKSTGKKLKSEALKFLSEFEEKVRNERKIIPVKLSEFEREYLEFISVKSKAYKRSVETSFKQFKLFIGNDILLKKIDVRLVEKFIHTTFNRSESAAGLYHRTLKASFSRALFWNYISVNPFKQVKMLKKKSFFPVFINEDELSKIIEVTKEKYLRVLFLTAFYTGMRLSEIINLKMNDIDFDKRIITVKNTETFTTKSGKERIIPICDILFDSLTHFKFKIYNINSAKDEYVFYKVKGVRLLPDFVSKKFKNSVRKAGINDKVHFHSLRHSTASLLAQRGVSLLVIKELLGHSSLHVTEMYSHLQRKDLENAVRLFGKVM